MVFEPRNGILLTKEETSPCKMEVRESPEFRWMIGSDGIIHGAMDLNNPSHPITPYVQCMLSALPLQPKVQRILNLGLGCGSLERYVHHAYPLVEITTVELFQERIEQTTAHFPFPKNIELVVGDAFQYVDECSTAFDFIFHDIFVSLEDSSSNQPSSLFYSYYQRLNPHGVLSMNYIPESSDQLLALLIELRKHFPTTALLEVPNHSNIIVFGLKGDKPSDHYLHTWGEQEEIGIADVIKTNLLRMQWLPPKI